MPFLSAIVAWSLRNRFVVLVALGGFVLAGIHAVGQLSVDAVPDLTNVQVQVVTSAPALAPVEVEKYISIPVERALAGIPRATEVRSISKYGISIVTVVFRDDTEIYFARQLVGERLAEAQSAVAAHYGKPAMAPITTGLGEIFQFVVRNPGLDAMQLTEWLDWTIAPQLRTVPGVVEVNSLGGQSRQYEVALDPLRLQAAGISVAEVVDALERSNANAGGGYLEHNGEHFVIGSDGLVGDADDLRSVVVGATHEGVPVTLATVADVVFTPKLRRGAASMDGEGEVVVGFALMLMGENSRAVTMAVKHRVAQILPSLPAGTTIEPFYDRSALVDRTMWTVGKNLLEGALLVILVLFLLLGDLRAGLVVATTIPLSLMFALIVMNAAGMSGNLMSLGAIDFGLIVDGAVIVVENAVRWLSRQRSTLGRALTTEERLAAIEGAAVEVRTASIFGEAIIAVVYLPLLSFTGIEGKLFRPMAATVLFALAGAFILSLTVVPVLTSFVVEAKEAHEPWLLRGVRRLYTAVYARVAAHTRVTLAGCVVILVATVVLMTRIGAEFVPQLDEGDVLIEARSLPGTALSKSVELQGRLQRALLQVPEVRHVVSKTGSPALVLDAMGIEESDVFISLKPQAEWRRGLSKADLTAEFEALIKEFVPEIHPTLSQPIQMRTNELLAGVKSDVAIMLYGADMDVLQRLGREVAAALHDINGVGDLRVEPVAGLKYLRIVPDRNKLARYGLSIEAVNRLTETLSVGYRGGSVLEGEKRFDIMVKTVERYPGSLEPLRSLPLKSASGQIVPLGDVAELRFSDGPAQVSRSQQSRRLAVEFNARGRDLMSVVRDAEAAMAAKVTLPVGYRVEWGGQFEHYTEAKVRLVVVALVALGLICLLLWFAMHSGSSALLILSNVPFAITGGVIALALREIPFSISAGVGFVGLFGVSVLNGLVLISFAQRLRAEGMSAARAINEAARMRLRPVVMTALVAGLGFVPMAVSTSPGSEVQRPLATVMVGGLVTATILTLMVMPLAYEWLHQMLAKPRH